MKTSVLPPVGERYRLHYSLHNKQTNKEDFYFHIFKPATSLKILNQKKRPIRRFKIISIFQEID